MPASPMQLESGAPGLLAFGDFNSVLSIQGHLVPTHSGVCEGRQTLLWQYHSSYEIQ